MGKIGQWLGRGLWLGRGVWLSSLESVSKSDLEYHDESNCIKSENSIDMIKQWKHQTVGLSTLNVKIATCVSRHVG